MDRLSRFCAALVLGLGFLPTAAFAGNFKNFIVSTYMAASTTAQLGNDPQFPARLQQAWDTLSKSIKIDKIYIETYRGGTEVDDSVIEPMKKFFTDHGVIVAGGMTMTAPGGRSGQQWESWTYTNPEDRAFVKRISEKTAKHFDEIILDDFTFVNTKYPSDQLAKGNKSWTDFRIEEMDDVAKTLLVGPAKAVNPKVKFVIKYPNWYEHFAGMGFDLDKEPREIFDGIFTGTETRDPVNDDQHLQAYESYNIMRYFENIAPGRNGGGWVDTGDLNHPTMYADRYAEQLWDTIFGKAKEMMLFAWPVSGVLSPGARDAWANLKTSFDYNSIPQGSGRGGQTGILAAAAANIALQEVDAVAGKLGNPIGIKSYRPPHALGEDYLHNYLGMVGFPIDLHPDFPAGESAILLTEAAKYDPEIVKKIEDQLNAGKTVVITSGLLHAMQDKGMQDICECRVLDQRAAITSFQQRGGTAIAESDLAKPMIIPEIQYLTNDAWMAVSGYANGNTYPILLEDDYNLGHFYVLTIPDNFFDLYEIPQSVMSIIQNTIMASQSVHINGPSNVSLFSYDNGTFVVQSFRDHPAEVTIMVNGSVPHLTDLVSGQTVNPAAAGGGGGRRGGGGRGRGGGGAGPQSRFTVTVPPHSFVALSEK